MRRNIYVNGEKIARDDEMQMDTINTMGLTFDYAAKPEYQDLCTATSHLTGQKINRFCHVHQNKEDLHKKQDMTRMLCRAVVCPHPRLWRDCPIQRYRLAFGTVFRYCCVMF